MKVHAELVIAFVRNDTLIDRDRALALSRGGQDTLYFESSESSYAQLDAFRDGAARWSIVWTDQEPDTLTVSGDLPPEHAGVRLEELGQRLTGFLPDAWSSDMGELSVYGPRPARTQRILTVAGAEPIAAPPIAAVVATLAALAPAGCRFVRLDVRAGEARAQLSATHEGGRLRVEVLVGARYVASRLDGGDLDAADIAAIFRAFYAKGARAPAYRWQRL